jgi:glucose/arabinose dehydrogenase/mono/diheme cytochrome c family protein
MRLTPICAALLAVLPADAGRAADAPAVRRVPWDASHVVGSPNPPPPYHVVRTFPKLKVVCPIAVARQPGSDRLILIHQMRAWTGHGRVLRIKDDPNADTYELLLDLDGIAYGLTFHPDFAENGYLYIGDNGPMSGHKKTRVMRYTMEAKPPYRLDPKSAKVIIEWDSDGHNGGDLAFGNDGLLYVSSGDGTSDSDTNHTGQDLSKLNAKVLRIDVDHPDPGRMYSVPKDNPFVGVKGARPETWAYGFRNPWRLHIDHKTGDLWVGQNGQDLWEQVYLVEKGANYGWSAYEGTHPFYVDRLRGPSPLSKPIAEHPHSEMRSLTGGVVYYGDKLPELRGAYVYGDWSTGKIFGIRHDKGRVTWHQELASTTLQITGFGLDSKGELLIADHGGGYYRLEPTPKDDNPAKFPTKLSETGLFTSVPEHRPHPALIPYSVNAALWSDGAEKERFIALPGLTQIDFTTSRGWNFPEGTVLVKMFSLNTAAAGRRRIETRLLTKQQGQWYGYSYLWNDGQTDADLVAAEGTDRSFEVRDSRAPGGQRRQTWHYPSRTECMVCHSRAANFVLGPSLLQMNKDDQLHRLEELGAFHVNWLDHLELAKSEARAARETLGAVLRQPFAELAHLRPELAPPVRRTVDQLWPSLPALPNPVERLEKRLSDEPEYTTLLPRRAEEYRRLVSVSDRDTDLETRARSYLHANCAQCHVEAGGGNAQIDLEITTPRDRMRLIGVKPLHDTFGIKDAKLIAPGDPERSILYQRLKRRGPGQMPPLATSIVDDEAVRVIHDWIKAMRE